jgi:hypothetical protein
MLTLRSGDPLLAAGGVMIYRFVLLSLFLAMPAAIAQAVNVSGDWKVTISTVDGTIHGYAAFKQNVDAVTGWLGPSASDPIPITLDLKGDKLTIRTHPQPGRNVAFAECEVTVGGDKMTGTSDKDQGMIEFVRTQTSSQR